MDKFFKLTRKSYFGFYTGKWERSLKKTLSLSKDLITRLEKDAYGL